MAGHQRLQFVPIARCNCKLPLEATAASLIGKCSRQVLARYTKEISKCGKAKKWQQALGMLSEMQQRQLEPNVISFNAAISTCERVERAVAVAVFLVFLCL